MAPNADTQHCETARLSLVTPGRGHQSAPCRGQTARSPEQILTSAERACYEVFNKTISTAMLKVHGTQCRHTTLRDSQAVPCDTRQGAPVSAMPWANSSQSGADI